MHLMWNSIAKHPPEILWPGGAQRSRVAVNGFCRDDHGAITTDFVVLTAALIAISMTLLTMIGGGTTTQADAIEKCMRIQAKQFSRNIDYKKQLRVAERRCSRL